MPATSYALTRWIVDEGDAHDSRAVTILLSAPDGDRCRRFAKQRGATTLFMPLWSDEEIESCR